MLRTSVVKLLLLYVHQFWDSIPSPDFACDLFATSRLVSFCRVYGHRPRFSFGTFRLAQGQLLGVLRHLRALHCFLRHRPLQCGHRRKPGGTPCLVVVSMILGSDFGGLP